jgi:hypothetical protein
VAVGGTGVGVGGSTVDVAEGLGTGSVGSGVALAPPGVSATAGAICRVGVEVAMGTGELVGVSVKVGKSDVKVARSVATGVAVAGSPYTIRATAGTFLVRYIPPTPRTANKTRAQPTPTASRVLWSNQILLQGHFGAIVPPRYPASQNRDDSAHHITLLQDDQTSTSS